MQPDNKETWFRLGQFELQTLDRPQLAYPHLARFVELDPQGARAARCTASALDRVNAGATPLSALADAEHDGDVAAEQLLRPEAVERADDLQVQVARERAAPRRGSRRGT